MYPTPGSFVHIQSYKHDGSLHRTWCKGFVLEADEKHIVVVTDRAWVIESDGFIGLFRGGFKMAAVGTSAALIFSYIISLIFKPKMPK